MNRVILVLFVFTILLGCRAKQEPGGEGSAVQVDLAEIAERGKLIAATGYGATSYFVYKGKPMGYEYELLELLADHLDLDLELRIVRDLDNVFDILNRGEADIIALGLTVTKERAEKIAFTRHHNTIRQVLVQRKPDNWRSMKWHQIEKALIRDPLDLLGETVHVWQGSSYHSRLINLMDEIGGDIDVVALPGYISTEELICQVSNGMIDYTVADENIALINSAYCPDIDVNTPISFPQRIAWAVRRNSLELLQAVNAWTEAMQDCTDFYAIYARYYKDRRGFRERAESPYYAYQGGQISKYDGLIKQHAEKLNWDWRLLASMIYQESRFDPGNVSWAGAVGLMQLIPETAELYGAQDPFDPVDNIGAGTRYLNWLENIFSEVPDTTEQTKFVLASYNAGQGHVFDARRLAEKYGKDPNVWDDHVGYYMLKKTNPKFFNDEVVMHGYCRGQEPYNYVNEILERYEHYRKHVD
jgi:membrane-bound lytic murein transglycosylase F